MAVPSRAAFVARRSASTKGFQARQGEDVLACRAFKEGKNGISFIGNRRRVWLTFLTHEVSSAAGGITGVAPLRKARLQAGSGSS